MYQKVTGQSKTTSPEHCPHSKPRKPSKVSIPRHFIFCQESLWVCLYREHTETSAGYFGRCVHTHGPKHPAALPTPPGGHWSRHMPQQRQHSSAAQQGNRAWLPKLALHPLPTSAASCLLQEICSWAHLVSLSSFPRSLEGHMKRAA